MAIDLAAVKEEQTAVIQCTIQNELHEAIDGTLIQSLLLTISDQASGEIINNREHVNILGVSPARVNGGMIDTQGLLDLRLDPADNVILDEGADEEVHLVLLEWTWIDDAVTKYGAEELILPVENLHKIGTI